MKYFIFFAILIGSASVLQAQNKYPDPEFSKEVYYLKKDSVNTVMRLEKGSSRMESKTKMGGMGGYEMGYTLDGEKSNVRLSRVPDLSFVLSTGVSVKPPSPEKDSIMRANGMDPSMMNEMSGGMEGMMDPTNMITLYKAEPAKSKRKIFMQKAGGAFGGKKRSQAINILLV